MSACLLACLTASLTPTRVRVHARAHARARAQGWSSGKILDLHTESRGFKPGRVPNNNTTPRSSSLMLAMSLQALGARIPWRVRAQQMLF